jgi:hypothetical protein
LWCAGSAMGQESAYPSPPPAPYDREDAGPISTNDRPWWRRRAFRGYRLAVITSAIADVVRFAPHGVTNMGRNPLNNAQQSHAAPVKF